MMGSEMGGAAIGAAGGGALGRLGSALGIPRRMVASALMAMLGGGEPRPTGVAALSGGGDWAADGPYADGGGGDWGGPAESAMASAAGEGGQGGSLLGQIMAGGGYDIGDLTERLGVGGSPYLDAVAGMAIDPLGWGGGLAGRLLGRARGAAASPGARLDRYAAQAKAPPPPDLRPPPIGNVPPAETPVSAFSMFDDLGDVGAAMPTAGRSPATQLLPPMPPRTLGGYAPDQLAAFGPGGVAPQIAPETIGAPGKVYKRVDPQVGALLKELGFMNEGGAMQAPLPNFAQVRGGSVLPPRGAEQLVPNMMDLAGLTPEFNHAARMRMLERLQGLGGMSATGIGAAPSASMFNNEASLANLADIRSRLMGLGG